MNMIYNDYNLHAYAMIMCVLHIQYASLKMQFYALKKNTT